ncbi:MAG: hypothetical protein R3E68_03600 [Burkholderiaceae bacterium]
MAARIGRAVTHATIVAAAAQEKEMLHRRLTFAESQFILMEALSLSVHINEGGDRQ